MNNGHVKSNGNGNGKSNGTNGGKVKKTAENAVLYNRLSGLYDFVFERMFRPRIQFGLSLLELSPGNRVLDMGVGTGLSIPHYPAGVDVVAVDISSRMLAKARERMPHFQGRNLQFARMDALNLAFPDHSFDAVFSSFVVSVVRDPAQCVREIERVIKPGGRILVINHFKSRFPILRALEGLVNPLCVRLGWRSNLKIEDLLDGSRLTVERIQKKDRIDLWTAILARAPHS